MHGRWEVGDAEWELLEPILRPARRADHRGRPWHDTRAVLNGVLWVLGTGAQWRELPSKYPPFQTCHRRFQQWVRTGKLERALRRLAQHLHAEGKLDLREAFIDASFSSAKKGALPSGRPSVGRARRSSLSPLVTVFLSPYLLQSASPHESQLVEEVLEQGFLNELHEHLIGDKAYDSDGLDQRLRQEYGIELIAPHIRGRKRPTQDGCPLRRYRRRWRVESPSPGCTRFGGW
jgi:transposase